MIEDTTMFTYDSIAGVRGLTVKEGTVSIQTANSSGNLPADRPECQALLIGSSIAYFLSLIDIFVDNEDQIWSIMKESGQYYLVGPVSIDKSDPFVTSGKFSGTADTISFPVN